MNFGKKKKDKYSLQRLKEIQSILDIKKSTIPNAGMGAFAKEDIPKGTYLGWYRGKYMNEKQYENTKNDDYIWSINVNGKEMYVDGRVYKNNNKLIYINGAKTREQKKDINAEMYQYDGKVHYRTIKKVKKGSELFIDYGDSYW